MLIALVVAALYLVLSVLPDDQLVTSRRIAAVPVAILMALSMALLALTVDGLHAWKGLAAEFRGLATSFRGFWQDLRR